MKKKTKDFNISVEHVAADNDEQPDGEYEEKLVGKPHQKIVETRINPDDGVEETIVTYDPMRARPNRVSFPRVSQEKWDGIFGTGEK